MRWAKKNQYRNRRIMITAGLLLLLFSAGCLRKKETPPPAPPNVKVSAVTQEDVPLSLKFSATLSAVNQINIIPRVSGYIEQCYFTEGSLVNKDDLLYLIDPRPFQASLDNYLAQLARDEALLVFYKSEVARYTKLAAKGAASEEKKESVTAQLNETIANIAQDKANIVNAELNLSFTKITAPFSGRIQLNRIKTGQLVTAQQDILTTLLQTDPIHAVFFMPRPEFFKMQLAILKGEALPVNEMEAVLTMPDGSEYPQKGKLDFTSFQIDPATDLVMLRAIFPNTKCETSHEYTLIPGQYAPLTLFAGQQPNTLLIPELALIEDQEGRHVYVVNQNNVVEDRKVTIGKSYNNQLMVQSGLKLGEKVIVEGVQKVRPGITVQTTPYSGKNDDLQAS